MIKIRSIIVMKTMKRIGKGGGGPSESLGTISGGSEMMLTSPRGQQPQQRQAREGGVETDSLLQEESSSPFSTTDSTRSSGTPPSPLLVNSSLLLGQILFGMGSVIAALGLPACNPFAFALYREICAGAILLGASVWWTARTTSRQQEQQEARSDDSNNKHGPKLMSSIILEPLYQNPVRFLWLGLAIFANQAGVIVGIKLAGPVAAAVWQPSQPIMTAAISMALRWEPINIWRVAGVAIAFSGCALMVMLASAATSSTTSPPTKQEVEVTYDGNTILLNEEQEKSSSFTFMMGNLLFFVNCLGTSLYVILSKKVLRLYTPLSVTAWTYNIAAIFMALTALLASEFDSVMDFICPDCRHSTSSGIWTVPPGAYFALFYFIIFNSVAAYAILTWATQYATGTLVMGFTVLQPVTAALFTMLLLGVGAYPHCSSVGGSDGACLDPPSIGSLFGMTGIFIGLYLVFITEPSKTTVTDYQELPNIIADEDTNKMTKANGKNNN